MPCHPVPVSCPPAWDLVTHAMQPGRCQPPPCLVMARALLLLAGGPVRVAGQGGTPDYQQPAQLGFACLPYGDLQGDELQPRPFPKYACQGECQQACINLSGEKLPAASSRLPGAKRRNTARMGFAMAGTCHTRAPPSTAGSRPGLAGELRLTCAFTLAPVLCCIAGCTYYIYLTDGTCVLKVGTHAVRTLMCGQPVQACLPGIGSGQPLTLPASRWAPAGVTPSPRQRVPHAHSCSRGTRCACCTCCTRGTRCTNRPPAGMHPSP